MLVSSNSRRRRLAAVMEFTVTFRPVGLPSAVAMDVYSCACTEPFKAVYAGPGTSDAEEMGEANVSGCTTTTATMAALVGAIVGAPAAGIGIAVGLATGTALNGAPDEGADVAMGAATGAVGALGAVGAATGAMTGIVGLGRP